ncbi:MAG: hypothetical protein IT338_09810 [Thermomicrobiales bacterium]|nr:hypothetical protein [Thermomicrobiales bacterium]
MTTRTDFSDDEWRLLTSMPQLAALGAMAAENDGPVSSTRELWASTNELFEAAKDGYPDNALVQAIAAAIGRHDDGAGLPAADFDATGQEALHMAVVEKALQTAPEVDRILDDRAMPEEAAGYREWIMGIARAGVEAAKTGFLGLSGARVTQRESLFLNQLSTALGAPEVPVRDWER